MKKKLLWLIAFVAFESTSAQDSLTLKLQDALEAALNNNKEILLAKLDQENAIAKFKQTNAAFLPQINLSYTASATNNPMSAFGFKLQQQSVSPTDFNPQLLNNPPATQNYATKAEWNQPLINLDMIYQRKAAEQQTNLYYYKTKRTKEYLTFEVQRTYAQLQLSHQATLVLAEGLRTVKAIFESSKNYYEKGYIQKSDLLLVQVKVASIERQLIEAKSNVSNISDYMSLLMGVSSCPIYVVEPMEKTIQAEKLETQISEDRADLKAMKSALYAQEIMVNSGKMSYLPKLNAFANYMINDKSPIGFGSNSYLVGAQLSWNLFNGTALRYRTEEQKIAHARIEQQISFHKDQSQQELNKTFRQLEDAELSFQQYETSVNQAAEALRILQNRFQQGLVSTNDLLQSQSTLSEQKLLLNEAVFKYNTTLAYLQFQTSITENK